MCPPSVRDESNLDRSEIFFSRAPFAVRPSAVVFDRSKAVSLASQTSEPDLQADLESDRKAPGEPGVLQFGWHRQKLWVLAFDLFGHDNPRVQPPGRFDTIRVPDLPSMIA